LVSGDGLGVRPHGRAHGVDLKERTGLVGPAPLRLGPVGLAQLGAGGGIHFGIGGTAIEGAAQIAYQAVRGGGAEHQRRRAKGGDGAEDGAEVIGHVAAP